MNRSACFAGEEDFRLYLGLLAELCARHSCALHAYVLMTNHVHLLLTPDDPEGPSRLMKHMGQRYVQSFNRRHERTGTLWEGRFKSSIVDSEAYLLRCQRYVEHNPVRAGMVGNARDYEWSSHRSNAYGIPSTFLTPHALYVALASTPTDRVAAYRQLFGAPLSAGDLQLIRHAANAGLPLGRAEFIESLGRRLNRRVAYRRPGRPWDKITGDRPRLSASDN